MVWCQITPMQRGGDTRPRTVRYNYDAQINSEVMDELEAGGNKRELETKAPGGHDCQFHASAPVNVSVPT